MAEFDQLILNNYHSLKPYAIHFTKNEDAAQDLVQDTLLLAFRHKNKFRNGSNISAWLFTIMRNFFINNYRKNKSRRKILSQLDVSPDGFFATALPDNESRLANKEIDSIIRSLPESFGEPFMLHVEGYKYDEIARRLQKPTGTIKSRIHFARKLLQEELKSKGYDLRHS
jgi:RNA polymerase sigma-70 factor (ECF subfamily)